MYSLHSLTFNYMIINKTISKNQFSKNQFSIYDIFLSSSIVSNFCCFQYILKQNEQITELIEKNKSLGNSINQLNTEVAKMGKDILIMHTKAASSPILINTSASGSDFFIKTLIITGLIATGAVTTYYFSSFMVAKLSSLSFYNPLALSKYFSFNSILTNLPLSLPFLDQKKEISVFLQELSVTLFIELLNGEVSSINFKQTGVEKLTPIIKAIEAYLKLQSSKDNGITSIVDAVKAVSLELPTVDEIVETASNEEVLSVAGTAADTLNTLSSLF